MSDLDALTTLAAGYAFMAAEQTIDEVYHELGMRVTEDARELHERIGRIASKVADDLEAHCRGRLAEAEKGDSWEIERVILERMRGNPKARTDAG